MADLTGNGGARHAGCPEVTASRDARSRRQPVSTRSPIRAAAGLGLAFVVGVLALVPAAAGADPLPAGYAYEQVSPEQTQGQRVRGGYISPDELSVMTDSVGGYAGTENLPDTGNSYVATRSDGGWFSSPLAPPAPDYPFIYGAVALDFTDDFQRSLWYVNLAADKGTHRYTPIVRNADGTFVIAGPTIEAFGSSYPIATSADLDTIVMRTGQRTGILTDGTTDTRPPTSDSMVVARRGEDGQLSVSQLAYRAGASMFTNCHVALGDRSARGSVSADGNKIFFAPSGTGMCAASANRRVWAKVGDADPIDLSATACTDTCGTAAAANFGGAARDGSRVYFTTTQKLVNDDLDTTAKADIYEYDFNATGQKLRPVTSSTALEGAGVLNIVRISEDGSYVYFVAKGRALSGAEANPEGLLPQVTDNNLYVYHRGSGDASGTIRFIGPLAAADTEFLSIQKRPAWTTTDGRFLLFESASNLTGERDPGDVYSEPYRYDAVDHELARIWPSDPAHNGTSRTAGTTLGAEAAPFETSPEGGRQKWWHPTWPISDDGQTIAFDTKERISPDDTNVASDTYMWQEQTGELTMLSDGKSVEPARLQAVSRSGGTVLFQSSEPIVSSHRSGAVALFAARLGGGFPDPPLPPEPCQGDGCQGSASPPPLAPAVGSVDFTGSGNVAVSGDRVAASVLVSRVKPVLGSAARVRVRVPAAGRISVSGASVRRANRSASKAATYSVRVALSSKAKRSLRKRKTLKVKVRVAFQAKAGRSASKTVTLTFKAKGGR